MGIRLGPHWERDLHESPYRLRFELNQSGPTHLNMFTSSYDRVRQLARAALGTETVLAIVAANPRSPKPFGITKRDWASGTAFDRLEAMGVQTSNAATEWFGYAWEQEEREATATLWCHRAVQLPWEAADILLWNQVAQEMGVYPQAPVVAKLVDLIRAVSVFAYDDRGMDITALAPEPIAGLYRRFDAWLLDFDRPRMSEVF